MRLRKGRRMLSAIGLLALISSLIWIVPWNDTWAQSGYGNAPTATDDLGVPTNSSPVAMDSAKNLIWVVNPDDDSVSVIGNLDSTPSVISTIPVGHEPEGIAIQTNLVDPTKYHVYVATPADNGITIINVSASSASSVTAVATKQLITGAEPWDVVATPDGTRVFVANSGQDTITVIRTDTDAIVGNVVLGNTTCNVGDQNRHFQPRGLAVTGDGLSLFVTRFLSFTKTGGVQSDDNGKEGVVCKLTVPVAIGSLPTVASAVKLASRDTGFTNPNGSPTSAYPNQLQSIVIRGTNAYLPNIAASPSPPLKFNVDTQAFVNRISNINTTPTDAGAVNLHLGARLPEPGKTKIFFANPWAMAFTNQAGSGNAYVVSSGSDLLVKLNVDSNGVLTFTGGVSRTTYIDLADPSNPNTSGSNAGKNPLGIVIRNISPSNNHAYVMNYVSRNVSVVDLTANPNAVSNVIQTTALPLPGTQDEQLQVGKEVFFTSRGHFNHPPVSGISSDIRLSKDGWQNCASCHFAALTDGVIWRFNSGPRKSIPLNATWSPQNPNDQRILNYSAIFDEVQDFELNIRNVSGPGPLAAGPPVVFDPQHGLIVSDTATFTAPHVVAPFLPITNTLRPQFTVTLPGSNKAWNALDAVKEWIRFAIRTPNGELTTDELTAQSGGNATGGLTPTDVQQGRILFFQAGCQKCHGGTKWSVSHKDFVAPPLAADISTEQTITTANAGQYLNRFLSDIGSYNLNVPGQGNTIALQPEIGGVEKDTAGKDALGKDFNGDGKGNGFNIPSLLGIWAVQPYYHNGACETLQCVLADVNHRKKGHSGPDILADTGKQLKVVAFLKSLDAETDFPFDLSIRAHDISVTPPAALKGSTVEIVANVSLFGVKSDLIALGNALGINHVVVHFKSTALGLDKDENLPFSAFVQDFGQAPVTTTLTIPANLSGNHGQIEVTVDANQQVQESDENNNVAQRNITFNNPQQDTTPPKVVSVAISDDNPFNDNDFTTASNNVKVKLVVSDPAGNGTPSGVKQFCLVSYYYDFVTRFWIPTPCVFANLPASVTGHPDTFIVSTQLNSIAGISYVFVWVRDGAGNFSIRPGFDFISFVPTGFVNLNRNDVLILRFVLKPGENLQVSANMGNGGFGDVDLVEFENFLDPNSARGDVSAHNGSATETVNANGPATGFGLRQVEIHAVVNSQFKITVTPTAQAASAKPAEELVFGSGISVAGPPALASAIGEDLAPAQAGGVFLPFAANEQ